MTQLENIDPIILLVIGVAVLVLFWFLKKGIKLLFFGIVFVAVIWIAWTLKAGVGGS